MKAIGLGSALGVAIQGAAMLLGAASAMALPGQSVDEVKIWIQGHPTLQPASGEKLLIRKADTAAQRFIFQASILPPGRIGSPANAAFIRSEQISFFDIINGVTRNRLEESLRTIYGPEIYQDYEQARIVVTYPGVEEINRSRNQPNQLLTALQGELRMGDRYAYWVEIVRIKRGVNYSGQLTILEKRDVEKLATELRNRTN